MTSAHFRREFLDFGQIPLHLAPPVPQCVIIAAVERALERPHAMFEVHDEQLLLNDRGRVVKREQVGKCVCIVLRLLEDAVLVKTGNTCGNGVLRWGEAFSDDRILHENRHKRIRVDCKLQCGSSKGFLDR